MNHHQDNSVKQQDTFVKIGPEGRIPMDYPAIIHLSAGNKYGTGFLINGTTIITAAHNITKKYNFSPVKQKS
jgi:V8-like Glu-specific endopeptidase